MDALAPMRAADQSGEKSVAQAVQEEVEDRMTRAAEELKAKYARGQGGHDTSVDGPTGAAYTAAASAERERRRALKEQERAVEEAQAHAEAHREAEVRAQFANQKISSADDEDDEDSDDEFLNELESSEDPELLRIRNLRMQQMRAEQQERMQNLRKGHGELSEIVQDEFLPRITSSKRAVCHFYHKDFHRCKIMDKHLAILAHAHLETLFLKIDAEKAPFFCEKLNVRVLPTVICFFDGVTKPGQSVHGFGGLSLDGDSDPDDWPTTRLEAKLGEIGVIDYTKPATESELRKYGLIDRSGISRSVHSNANQTEDGDY